MCQRVGVMRLEQAIEKGKEVQLEETESWSQAVKCNQMISVRIIDL